MSSSERIRAAAITEFGLAGWVDPHKVAIELKLSEEEVIIWLQQQSNYVTYDRPGGSGIGYRQVRYGVDASA